MNTLYTIGYSTYDSQSFVSVLKKNNITALVDVRSSPYSKFKPEFNREILINILGNNKIQYVFLGNELGARSKNNSCYINGRADHGLISKSNLFNSGIERIIHGLEKYSIVLMCAEVDPITCHRDILVCRILKNFDIDIKHILANGVIESNEKAEERLLKEYSLEKNDLFYSDEETLNIAYDKRSIKIAYRSGETENE